MNYIAFILGILGVIYLSISVQINNKKNVLAFQIIANAFYGIQYLILGSLAAGCMSGVSISRSIIFYIYDKKKKKIPLAIFILLVLIIIFIGTVTYNGILSIIPIIITIFYTYAVYQDNLKVFRYIMTAMAIIWIAFNIYVGAYGSLLGNIIEISNGIVAIYRYDIKRKNSF